METVSDAKIYNEITTLIPPESMSVPLILHSILEQVEAQIEHATNHPLTSNQPDDVGRYLHEKLMTLSLGRDQQKVRRLNIEEILKKNLCLSLGNGKTRSESSVFQSNGIRTDDGLLW